MKKLRNILFSMLSIFSILIPITVDASSSAPSSFTVRYSDLHRLDGSKYLPGGSIHFFYKVNSDGKVIYCMQRTSDVVYGVETYTLTRELDSKYAYVMEHGYPNVSMTGDNDKDYFITGMAIWYLLDPSDSIFRNFDFASGSYRGQYNEVSSWINKLISGANSYSYSDPSIKINNSSSSMSLSSDGKYYVSNAMTVGTSGKVNNYTVSLNNAPSGTIVTDSKGNNKTSFSSNESFIVKVPKASIKSLSNEFSVSVSGEGSISKAYLYSPSHSNYQTTGTIYTESKSVSDKTTLRINVTTELQVSKIDATTGSELEGAHLTVKDSNGKVVESWVSTREVHVIKGLKPGKYTLTEEIAPDGYKLSSETITFEIKSDGSVTKVVMKNYLKDKPVPVVISKRDITTGEELEGAHLEVKNEKGEVVEAWVSTRDAHTIEGLKPGKYTLTEVIAPDGYELSKEVIEFVVKEDGTVDGDIIMYNRPETVEVPSTSSFKTITASLIGIIVIGLGFMTVYRNVRKNEE